MKTPFDYYREEAQLAAEVAMTGAFDIVAKHLADDNLASLNLQPADWARRNQRITQVLIEAQIQYFAMRQLSAAVNRLAVAVEAIAANGDRGGRR